MKKVRILFLLVPFVFYSCGILQNSRQAVSSSMSAASLISTSSRLLKRGGKAVASSTNTIKGLSISETEIIELSRKYMQKLDSASTIASEDNKYAIRLDSIMRKFDGIDEFNINYKVYINDEVNAFASGDGSLRVYSGLMDKMTNDEVFAVVSHELGHVKNKDTKDKIKHAYFTVAAHYAVGSVSPKADELSAEVLSEIGQVLSTSVYSRKQEYAADEAAFNYCVANGVSP